MATTTKTTKTAKPARCGYHSCDGCGKERRDVQSCGRDANGDPDTPDLCFLCRVEYARGREFDPTRGRYVSSVQLHAEAEERAYATMADEPEPADLEDWDDDEWYLQPIPEFEGACEDCGRPKINHYFMASAGDLPRFVGCDEAQLHERLNAAQQKVAP